MKQSNAVGLPYHISLLSNLSHFKNNENLLWFIVSKMLNSKWQNFAELLQEARHRSKQFRFIEDPQDLKNTVILLFLQEKLKYKKS